MFKVCTCYPPLGRHGVEASISKEGVAEEGADHPEGGIPQGIPEGILQGSHGVIMESIIKEEGVVGEWVEEETGALSDPRGAEAGVVPTDSVKADAEEGVTEGMYRGGVTEGVTEEGIVAEGATEVNIIEEGVINKIIGKQVENCGYNLSQGTLAPRHSPVDIYICQSDNAFPEAWITHTNKNCCQSDHTCWGEL